MLETDQGEPLLKERVVTLIYVHCYLRILLSSCLTLLGSESKLGGQTVQTDINAINKRSSPIPGNMPERKTIWDVSHVRISGLSLRLVYAEVLSDLALWSASRAAARASHTTWRSLNHRPHPRRAWA